MEKRHKGTIVGMCDSLVQIACTIRAEYLREAASDRELLCGEWVRPDGKVFLRVRKEGDRYLLDECWGNAVNSRLQTFSFRLLRDEAGNLYTETQERAVAYDRDRDLLRADGLGDFTRKTDGHDTK